jgi:hypothetical protein
MYNTHTMKHCEICGGELGHMSTAAWDACGRICSDCAYRLDPLAEDPK